MGLIFGDKTDKADMESLQRQTFKRHDVQRVQLVKKNLNASTCMDQDPGRQSLFPPVAKNQIPRETREAMRSVCVEALKPRPARSNLSNVDCSITGAPFVGLTEYSAIDRRKRNVEVPSVGRSSFEPPRDPITGKLRSIPTPIFEQPGSIPAYHRSGDASAKFELQRHVL